MKPAFYSVGKWGCFPRGKVAGVWSWPPASNTEVKNKWSCTFASSMCHCGMFRNFFSYYLLFFRRFYLVHFLALISLFQKRSTSAHTLTPPHWHCKTLTCFSPQRATLRGYNWYISEARLTKWVTISGCITYYTLLTKLNFTSGNSFCWLCCWKVSFVLEDGSLNAETCRSGIVQMKWC